MIPGMNYPRINQYRYLLRAGRRLALATTFAGCAAIVGIAAVAGCLLFAAAGAYGDAAAVLLSFAVIAGLLIVAAACAFSSAGGPLERMRRCRIGADSEDEVAAVLEPLRREGWLYLRGVNWPGIGDIDGGLVSPDGQVAFVVETKTRTYLAEHLRRVYAQATWWCRRYGCRRGAVPVLVPARTRNLERFEGGVLIVSPDRLINALHGAHAVACAAAA